MPRKASIPAAVADWLAPKFRGKTFALTGKLSSWQRERIQKCIEIEEGRVIEDAGSGVDYLVTVPTPSGGLPQQAKKLLADLQQLGMTPQVLNPADLGKLVLPTREQAIALLKSGNPAARERWNNLSKLGTAIWAGKVDLQGSDLRGADLPGVSFSPALIDGADLSKANLTDTFFSKLSGVRFDGACLAGAQLWNFHQCSFQDADLSAVRHLWSDDWASSNFQGANLRFLSRPNQKAASVCFRKADLCGAMLSQSDFTQADFTRADLSTAHLSGCNLTGANLSHAMLSGADLSGAALVNANLAGADLTEASLIDVDLTGANIAGARFKNANRTSARMDGLDLSKARGLDTTRSTLGPRVIELEQVVQGAMRFSTEAIFDLADSYIEVGIELMAAGKSLKAVTRSLAGGTWRTVWTYPRTVGLALEGLAHFARHARLRLDSIKVKCEFGARREGEVKKLALAAWCEAAGVSDTSPQTLQAQRQAQQTELQALREEMLAELRGGPAGIRAWNARPAEQRQKASPFAAVDLSGADLAGVDLSKLAFPGANLAGARLNGAKLDSSDFGKANLEKADLTDASGFYAKFARCNLARAVLREANFFWATFTRADLRGADLREVHLRSATFTSANLCGANLSSAHLESATFNKAAYDDRTRWPAGFVPSPTMVWQGQGPRPGAARPVPVVKPVAALDFSGFLTRLRTQVDASRLDNALRMLQAERFQLFAEVKPEALVGVVRSQSSSSRVYSCRLAADGSFACCTQNLLPCGGLRGAVCKHLLVLIVGLAKVDQVDRAAVDAWVRASRAQRPVLNKEVMTETFLRYKGAEAGEVDWRPTETLPEDYYAL